MITRPIDKQVNIKWEGTMKSSVRREVERLMKRYKIYRSDDKALVIKVWEQHGLELTPHQKYMFFQAPSADVILRRRREFSPKYPATAAITEKRYGHFTEFKEEYSTKRGFINWFRRNHSHGRPKNI